MRLAKPGSFTEEHYNRLPVLCSSSYSYAWNGLVYKHGENGFSFVITMESVLEHQTYVDLPGNTVPMKVTDEMLAVFDVTLLETDKLS